MQISIFFIITPGGRGESFRLIQAPIVLITETTVVCPQRISQAILGIMEQMLDHTLFGTAEIHLEPLINTGDIQPSLDHPRPTGLLMYALAPASSSASVLATV